MTCTCHLAEVGEKIPVIILPSYSDVPGEKIPVNILPSYLGPLHVWRCIGLGLPSSSLSQSREMVTQKLLPKYAVNCFMCTSMVCRVMHWVSQIKYLPRCFLALIQTCTFVFWNGKQWILVIRWLGHIAGTCNAETCSAGTRSRTHFRTHSRIIGSDNRDYVTYMCFLLQWQDIYIKEHTVVNSVCAFFSFSLLTVITVTEAPYTDLNQYTQSAKH